MAVKRAVDEDRSAGRFLLTGSAPTPDTTTHSGAGRITPIRMRPLTLAERLETKPTVSLADLLRREETPIAGITDVNLDAYTDEILAGGFPGLRNLPTRRANIELDGYLRLLVEHDLEENGLRVTRPATVTAWMRGYAAATATTTSWEKIRNATASSGGIKSYKGSLPYIELLKTMRILDPINAWKPTNSHFKRLTGDPKHHLADTALATRLLKLTKSHLLQGGTHNIDLDIATTRKAKDPFLGLLFESLSALTIRVTAQTVGAEVYHLRTQGGEHEVDFIVEGDNGVIGIEVKLTPTINDSDVKHLHWLKTKLGKDCVDMAVITTGNTAFRRTDGVAVIPLALLGA